jgi:hypothetical protein
MTGFSVPPVFALEAFVQTLPQLKQPRRPPTKGWNSPIYDNLVKQGKDDR